MGKGTCRVFCRRGRVRWNGYLSLGHGLNSLADCAEFLMSWHLLFSPVPLSFTLLVALYHPHHFPVYYHPHRHPPCGRVCDSDTGTWALLFSHCSPPWCRLLLLRHAPATPSPPLHSSISLRSHIPARFRPWASFIRPLCTPNSPTQLRAHSMLG